MAGDWALRMAGGNVGSESDWKMNSRSKNATLARFLRDFHEIWSLMGPDGSLTLKLH